MKFLNRWVILIFVFTDRFCYLNLQLAVYGTAIGALVMTNNLFCVQSNCIELLNVFTGQLPTHEQTCDMMSFCYVKEQSFQNYVIYHICITMSYSSIKAPLWQHKLMSMATSKNVWKPGVLPRRKKLNNS